MILSELIQRSPIRIFEQSIHGGLKPGEVGIIASPSGVGKTSVLVQLALDKLLQKKKVIHVSFTQHTHYVLSWYEDIFEEFINKKGLENAGEIKDELVKNRVSMNFNQDGMSTEQVIKSLRAMIVDGGFAAEAIMIDGYKFPPASKDNIASVKALAKELGLVVWFSCTVKDGQHDNENIPLVIKDFADLVDVIIVLEPKTNHIELSVAKDRNSGDTQGMTMRLDPETLLILEG